MASNVQSEFDDIENQNAQLRSLIESIPDGGVFSSVPSNGTEWDSLIDPIQGDVGCMSAFGLQSTQPSHETGLFGDTSHLQYSATSTQCPSAPYLVQQTSVDSGCGQVNDHSVYTTPYTQGLVTHTGYSSTLESSFSKLSPYSTSLNEYEVPPNINPSSKRNAVLFGSGENIELHNGTLGYQENENNIPCPSYASAQIQDANDISFTAISNSDCSMYYQSDNQPNSDPLYDTLLSNSDYNLYSQNCFGPNIVDGTSKIGNSVPCSTLDMVPGQSGSSIYQYGDANTAQYSYNSCLPEINYSCQTDQSFPVIPNTISKPRDVSFGSSDCIPRYPCGDQRRPNISHSTLTKEQKIRRSKDINNDSSSRYRKRKTNTINQIREEEQLLMVKNTELRSQKQVLERQKQIMQMLVNNAMRNT